MLPQMQTGSLRVGDIVIALWGLGLLYAAWRPNSVAGWLLVGPFRTGNGLGAIRPSPKKSSPSSRAKNPAGECWRPIRAAAVRV